MYLREKVGFIAASFDGCTGKIVGWFMRCFHTLKTECVHHHIYAIKDQARQDLFAYIEGFYNPRRLHSALGYLSPAEMERAAA